MTIREQIEAAKKADLLTVRQVALLTQYDEQTIYRKTWKNQIPGVVKIGRGVRFSRPVILAWAKLSFEKRDIRPV